MGSGYRAIAFGDFVGGLQLFAVFVLDAQRLADVVHSILIRRGIVAAGGFVAHRIGVFPVGVHVTGRQDRARLGVLPTRLLELAPAGTCCGC